MRTSGAGGASCQPSGPHQHYQLRQQGLNHDAEVERSVDDQILRADRGLHLDVGPGRIKREHGDPPGHGRLDNPVVGDVQLTKSRSGMSTLN